MIVDIEILYDHLLQSGDEVAASAKSHQMGFHFIGHLIGMRLCNVLHDLYAIEKALASLSQPWQ